MCKLWRKALLCIQRMPQIPRVQLGLETGHEPKAIISRNTTEKQGLNWFMSSLNGRTQYVRSSTTSSLPSAVLYVVPQGSVLGPILFLLYTADLLQLVIRGRLHLYAYADETPIYGSCIPSDTAMLQEHMSVCVDEVSLWMASNWLLPNPAKTEVLWCSSAQRQHQIPTGSARIGNTSVVPVSVVRDLGFYIDADLKMSSHITETVRACFAAPR